MHFDRVYVFWNSGFCFCLTQNFYSRQQSINLMGLGDLQSNFPKGFFKRPNLS